VAEDAVETRKRRLIPLATVITPNLPEAEVLGGPADPRRGGMREAAAALRALACRRWLLKGGHLDGPEVTDLRWNGGWRGGIRRAAHRDAPHPWHQAAR